MDSCAPQEKMWLVHAEGAISKNSAGVTCNDDRIGGLERSNALTLHGGRESQT
jgi:hypothetical protein